MPAEIKTKNCVPKLCIWRPGRSYVFPLHVHFMFVFFWGEVRSKKFRDLIDFGLHCSLRVSSISFHFISIRVWVENLYIKNCIKNLMVVMPSYFYEENKYLKSYNLNFLKGSVIPWRLLSESGGLSGPIFCGHFCLVIKFFKGVFSSGVSYN